ncbi:NADPH-dependent F420 reductase [Novosphingobium malaysiense]|uniref:F420-dependent NADP reductase n=1 Tax=Novosphingobium malaysiense TaxID=1348853 RepID=A0A0B1ZDH2_9SPHN|nr:NADPH-dependent F420 reductase [Novosphingobium malaysiense]KHK89079.1 F420-dependent NADP reductase [Novosphingobium malaysiense]
MPDTIAVIGGTGALGRGIARRLAKAGRAVIVGSRSAQSAQRAADELGHDIRAAANADAAAGADLIIVTVPFAAQEATLKEIAPAASGKVVVDATVPLVPPRVARVQLPEEGSAAVRAQTILGPDVAVVGAFHNVAAAKLMGDARILCDVLVFGDDKQARAQVVELSEAMGLRAFQAGPLASSAAAEALTSVLIFLNKSYGINGAGLQITGEAKPA